MQGSKEICLVADTYAGATLCGRRNPPLLAIYPGQQPASYKTSGDPHKTTCAVCIRRDSGTKKR